MNCGEPKATSAVCAGAQTLTRHMKTFLNQTVRPAVGSLALAAAVALTGCASTVKVTDNSNGSYRLGELRVYTDRDFTKVHDAVPKAFKDLNLFQTKDEKEVVEAELTARDQTDTRIVVSLKDGMFQNANRIFRTRFSEGTSHVQALTAADFK